LDEAFLPQIADAPRLPHFEPPAKPSAKPAAKPPTAPGSQGRKTSKSVEKRARKEVATQSKEGQQGKNGDCKSDVTENISDISEVVIPLVALEKAAPVERGSEQGFPKRKTESETPLEVVTDLKGADENEAEESKAKGFSNGAEPMESADDGSGSVLTFSDSSASQPSQPPGAAQQPQSRDEAQLETGWTLVTNRKSKTLPEPTVAEQPGSRLKPPRIPSCDALSQWISSVGSQPGDLQQQAESDMKDSSEDLTSFSLMDSLRLKLGAALAELKSGRAEVCANIIHGTLRLFEGLEPYLQSNNRAMSACWQGLQQATAAVDWQHHYVNCDTKHLYHKGMGISPLMLNTLQFLCHMARATNVLEIGTFTGLAALGMAEVLPTHGSVLTFEQDPFLVDFAKRELQRSLHGRKVDVRCGDAMALLKRFSAVEPGRQFELIFIDGCKSEYQSYLETILEHRLLAPLGIIVIDDVLWKGGVYEPFACESLKNANMDIGESPWPTKLPDNEVASVMASLNEWISRDPRFESLTLPLHNGVTILHHASSQVVRSAADSLQSTPSLPQMSRSLTRDSALTEAASPPWFDPCSAERQSTAPARMDLNPTSVRLPLPLRFGITAADDPAYLEPKSYHAGRGLGVTRQTSAPASLFGEAPPSHSWHASSCVTPSQLWGDTPEHALTPQLVHMSEPAFVVPMQL